MDRPTRRLVTALGATAAAGLLGAATLGGLALGQGAPAGAGAPSPRPPAGGVTQLTSATAQTAQTGATITVSATGQVSGAPDTVTLQLGVTASSSTAAGALDQADSDMTALESVFLKYVPRKDLQTSNLALNPNYDSSGVISGYSADEELTVTMSRIALAGQLVDSAAHAVGNDVHLDGISFSISNTSGLLAAAREQAMQNAHLEASELAAGAGVALGPIKSVTDQEQQAPVNVYPVYGEALPAAAKAVPLQAGSQQLSVQVQVVYELGK